MKLLSFVIFSLLFAANSLAQTATNDRNSLSIILLDYADSYREPIHQVFDLLRLDDRYDINHIPTRYIIVKGQRSYTDKEGNTVAPDRMQQIMDFLNTENTGLEIISYLFNRNPQNGQLSLERLFQRGIYNATDENVLESLATKRGDADLQEAGFRLIDRSYILVYDYANIGYEYRKASGMNESDYYWYATPAAYLFKIEWNDELQKQLFDCWIDENTSSFEIGRRKKAFENLLIPVKFVMKATDNDFYLPTGIVKQQEKVVKGEKRIYDNEALKDAAFTNLIYKAADILGEKIESKHVDFRIHNILYGIHPPRAKIGKKENVRTNDRYYVYEHRMNDDGTIRKSRRGVIRATNHIADNRQVATGHTPTTEFYQLAGRKLSEGMTIEEKQSLYFNLDLGYRYGNLEGGYIGLSTNLYATRAASHNAMMGVTVGKDAVTVTLDYGFGLRGNNFDIYPYIGAGLDSFLNDKEEDADSSSSNKRAWLAQGGIRFDLNIYYPVQLFGAVEYNYVFSKGDAYEEKVRIKDRNPEGVNAYGGLRICF